VRGVLQLGVAVTLALILGLVSEAPAVALTPDSDHQTAQDESSHEDAHRRHVRVTLDDLSAVVNGNTVTASVTVTTSDQITLARLGVCVRTDDDGNVDFPLDADVQVSADASATVTRTKTFPEGRYTLFGCILFNGKWTNLGRAAFTASSTAHAQRASVAPGAVTGTQTPSRSSTPATSSSRATPSTPETPTAPRVPASPGTAAAPTSSGTPAAPERAPTSGPAAGLSLAFADEFDDLSVGAPGATWGHTTSAYAFGDHNPGDNKLDWVSPSAMSVSNGVLTMTATPRDGTYWNTGLLTTEPGTTGGDGFTVRAGDFLVNRVAMPTGNSGAWPALWTWLNGNGEIDAFEWHSDNSNLLELSNHINRAGRNITSSLVAPGRFVWIGVALGATSNTWYIGDTLDSMTAVFVDGTGIGSTQPHIIANLSISSGTFHPRPSGSNAIVYQIDSIRVYR